MIATTMALAAAGERRSGRAEQSREARFPRLVALILDTIFVSLLSALATAVYGATEITGVWNPNGLSSWSSQTSLSWIFTAALWLGYYTVCEGMFSATPGKALNGLCVVSLDERPLTLRSVVLRNALRLADALPVMYVLGGVLVLGSECSQRLGDLAARTTVVRRRDAPEPGVTRSSGWRAGLILLGLLLGALAFTAGFDYFGRPEMDVQTLYQEHQLLDPSLTSYTLGTPAWSWGTVRYPIKAAEPDKTCSGYVELQWFGFAGWRERGGELDCVPR